MNLTPAPPRKNLDQGWIGFVCGMTAPFFSLYVFYLIRFSHLSFGDFYRKILVEYNIVTSSISLCVIANLLVFFIFIWSNRNYAARGVLLSTLFYAAYVVYQKYIR